MVRLKGRSHPYPYYMVGIVHWMMAGDETDAVALISRFSEFSLKPYIKTMQILPQKLVNFIQVYPVGGQKIPKTCLAK